MPKILSLISPKILDQVAKVFKLDKVLQYVEQPNELDDKVETLEIKIEALEKTVIEMGKDG